MTLKNQHTPFASRPEKRSIGIGAREVKRIEDLEAKSSPEGSAGTGGSGEQEVWFRFNVFFVGSRHRRENPLQASQIPKFVTWAEFPDFQTHLGCTSEVWFCSKSCSLEVDTVENPPGFPDPCTYVGNLG